MIKRSVYMFVAIILVIGALVLIKVHQVREAIAAAQRNRPPPASVSTIKASVQDWQQRLHSVGSIVAVKGVTLSNELAGTIRQIAFESGDRVKQGALLVHLDTSTDEAQLQGLEAQAELARLSLDRARDLRKNLTNSQADLDAAQAQFDSAVAAVNGVKATIAKKVIRAPFSGELGIRLVNLGQYLPAGTPIVSLQALDPLFVNFSLPQQDFHSLKIGQSVELRVDSYPGRGFTGKITAINSQVDDATRNIEVQATLPNPDNLLRPGMFASVNVVLAEHDQFVTLPQTAIVYNPYGDAVYVVKETKSPTGGTSLIARQQFVKLGDTRGDQVAITKGVAAGDVVITSGQIKLRNGIPVLINNSVLPEDNPAPTPPNT
jgi:membrane fusion protein, multidrug efflux system